MPLPSGSSLRYIRPVSFSCSVVATSTENTCTPDFVTISSGSMLAACAPAPTTATIAATTAGAIQPLSFRPIRLKPMNTKPDDCHQARPAGKPAGATWQLTDRGNAAQCDFRVAATPAVRSAEL